MKVYPLCAKLIIFLPIIILSSCKSKERKLYDDIYDNFKNEQKVEYGSSAYDYAKMIVESKEAYDSAQILEAVIFISNYRKDSTINSIQELKIIYDDSVRFSKIGVWEAIRIDDQEEKCNRKQVHYLLKAKLFDTTELKFATKYLAEKALRSIHKNDNCAFPIMSSVFIYKSKNDYLEGLGPIAGCNITPADQYKGRIFINEFMLYK